MRLHLHLAGHRFNFSAELMLAIAASLAVPILFSVYVDALHRSVERGEMLRQAQRADAALRRDAVQIQPQALVAPRKVATLAR